MHEGKKLREVDPVELNIGLTAPAGDIGGLGEQAMPEIALHDEPVPVLHQRRRRENGPPDHFLTLLHP